MYEKNLYNVDAETYFLSGILFRPEFYWTYGDMRPGDFFTADYQKIWKTMQDLVNDGKEIDYCILESEHGREVVSRISGNSSMHNMQHYYDMIKDYSRRRRLRGKHMKLEGMINSGTMEEVESLLKEMIVSDRVDDDIISMKTVVQESLASWEQKPIQKIPTGYKRLDSILNGGFSPGQLITIGARPSVGKTAMMLNLAVNNANAGYVVGYMSMEMMVREMLDRYLSLEAGSPLTAIEKRTDNENVLEKIASVTGENIYMIKPTKDIQSLCMAVKRMKQTTGINFLYLDYLQLMIQRGNRSTADQAIGELTNALKQLALSEGIVIIMGSQISRDGAKGMDMPKLHHLRESGNIEQDCDIVIMLDRDLDDEGRQVPMDFKVAKNRNGPIGEGTFLFQGGNIKILDHIV